MADLELYWNGDSDNENIRRYTIGGFHPVCLGDVVSSHQASPDSPSCSVDSPAAVLDSPAPSYRILHKLGRGSFSTVWFAEALHEHARRYVALKICVADAEPRHELDIFSRLSSHHESAPPNVLQLCDSFSIQGPNGLHTVLVHDVLGGSLSLARSPIGYSHAKTLCRQITRGLVALHRRGIVHGDLHTGNIGIVLPTLKNHSPRQILDYFGHPECTIVFATSQPAHPDGLPPYLVPSISVIDYLMDKDSAFMEVPLRAEIMDLGNSTVVDEETRPFCTAAAVCAPELMFERVARSVYPPSTRASDIWSLACTIYELVFGGSLFHWAAPNDALLGAMAKLCGDVPQEWKDYWESREKLRNICISPENADAEWQSRLQFHTTHKFGKLHPQSEVAEIFTLLRSMLRMDPECRASAEEVLGHPWFARDPN